MQRRVSGLLTLVLLCACGGKKGDSAKTKDDAASGPSVAPLAMPTSGVDKIARMNFVYGDGWPAYDKAVAANAKRDAASARAYAEQAIGKDAYHYDAHRLLAALLAQAGEHAAAVDHLVTALSGDYWAYGPTLAMDPALTEFFASPGLTDERMHVFVATGLVPTEQRLDPSERIEIEPTPLSVALEHCRTGRIEDGKTLAALLFYATFVHRPSVR